jgi:hypothetical protein
MEIRTLDSFESSPSAEGMPVENRIKIINALLGDHDVVFIYLDEADFFPP